MSPPRSTRFSIRRLVRDEAGVTAIVVGLSLTALMGFAGLGIDLGLWYADKRAAQGAADAAAYTAAIDYAAGDTTAYAAAAKAVTAQDGYTHGSGGVTVTVNKPPASGPNTATTGAVEVIVQKTETLLFAKLFINSATVTARAVAVAGSGGQGDCIVALDTSAATSAVSAGVDITGSANINLNNCGMQVNASGSDALDISGSASLTMASVNIVGNYSLSGSAAIHVSGATTTSAPSLADPYANMTVPATGACAGTNSYSGSSGATLSPGTFCNGLSFSGSGSYTLNPGVYIINGGSFSVSGSTTITGSGVTIVLTGSSASNYATVSISGSTTVAITAPTSGATKGLAFFQDGGPQSANAGLPTSGTDSFTGSSAQAITGAIYFPTQKVTYTGSTSGASPCTQLVAWQIKYTGSSTFNNSCTGTGVRSIGVTTTGLVE